MFRNRRMLNLEKDMMQYIKAYFKDITQSFDVLRPVYETLIQKTMMEPTFDTLLCYIMGQIIGIVNMQLELAGLSVDEKADITESLYKEIQISIVTMREDLEREKHV